MMVLKVLGGDDCHNHDFRSPHLRPAIIVIVHEDQQVINDHKSGYNVGVVHAVLPLAGGLDTYHSNKFRMNAFI